MEKKEQRSCSLNDHSLQRSFTSHEMLAAASAVFTSFPKDKKNTTTRLVQQNMLQ